MPRKPNTESRRAEIVAAMLSVMAKHGYEKATIQIIAKEADLAPGLIHYHFATKQEILLAVIKLINRFSETRFAQIATSARNPEERLNAYLQARLGLGEGAAPELVSAWVMIGAEAVRQAEVRVLFEQAIATELRRLTGLLQECFAQRHRDSTGASTLAAGLMAMMEGAFQLATAANTVMPTGYAADAATAYARQSIEAAEPLR